MKLSKTIDLNSKKMTIDLEKKAKRYDFTSTSRFSKELLVFFENWGNNYARILSNSLLVRLRTNVKAHMESVNQMTYASYVEQHANEYISVVYTLPPLKGPFVIDFDWRFAALSIDTLSGGNFGEAEDLKDVTDVEKALIRILTGYFLEAQQKCWADYEYVNQKVRSVELNPLMIQLLPDNETILLMEFSIEAGTERFPFKVVIPHQSIENVIEKINKHAKDVTDVEAPTDEAKTFLAQTIQQMRVEACVELGKTMLTFDQMRLLKEGGFVQLDQKITDLLTVYVEGEEIFKAQPVQVNGKLCVQVVEVSKQLNEGLLQRLVGGSDHEG